MSHSRHDYERAADVVRSRTKFQPGIGLVLGSGLGGLADIFSDRVVIPYEEIPGWPRSTVHGHAGQLVVGHLEGKVVVAQQGRAHYYEGYTPREVTFPARVMHSLGVQTLILTNAAGALNTDFRVGDLMLINDHISLPGLAGHHPLVGPNDDSIGPRFVGMTHTYDEELRKLARRVSEEAGVPMHEGVYVCVSGPTYETPAEIRMLRMVGGDAVGMSTVHEVAVARHSGMRVMACSGITNVCVDRIDSAEEASHEEVLEAGSVLVPRLSAVLRGVLRALP